MVKETGVAEAASGVTIVGGGLDDVYVAVPTTNGFLLSSLMASTLATYLMSAQKSH